MTIALPPTHPYYILIYGNLFGILTLKLFNKVCNASNHTYLSDNDYYKNTRASIPHTHQTNAII